MDKGRAKMVQDQLKERNEQLDQQAIQARKDLHAQATQRATFEHTFQKQMDSLETKIKQLN